MLDSGQNPDASDGDESFAAPTEPKAKKARTAVRRSAGAQPPFDVGAEVRLKDDLERGIVTERLAGSWLMVKYPLRRLRLQGATTAAATRIVLRRVAATPRREHVDGPRRDRVRRRYASGYASKQRPGQLVALTGGPGLEPLTDAEKELCAQETDAVASLQAHVDRDVTVATTSAGSVKNQFVDAKGAKRRQFVVFEDGGQLGVRCDICGMPQVLSDTIRGVASGGRAGTHRRRIGAPRGRGRGEFEGAVSRRRDAESPRGRSRGGGTRRVRGGGSRRRRGGGDAESPAGRGGAAEAGRIRV